MLFLLRVQFRNVKSTQSYFVNDKTNKEIHYKNISIWRRNLIPKKEVKRKNWRQNA